jgi:D-3-phosphoglycerate dehydrogenase
VSARRPVVLYVDRGFDHRPIAAALAADLDARETVGPDEAGDVVALVTGAVAIGRDEVAPYPALRTVVTCSIGTDHLDVAALAELGIAVRNTPTYCTEEVADHALACVLAGWRGLFALDAAVRAGGWDYAAAGLLRRADASCLGIVGLGRIGRALAARARALGIEVVAHDPYAAGGDVELVELSELLARADAVSLHLPWTPGPPPLIAAAELALMRPDAVLVNLARPGVADLDAVGAALREGRLGAAFWDVWPQEPPVLPDSRLDAPRLVVTPHAAWYSAQAETAYYDEAIAALREELLD